MYYTMKVSTHDRACFIRQLTHALPQWVLDSVLPERTKDDKVKEKQLEALKRLGHHQLELDEYESASRTETSFRASS